jgi:hypothetical protein
LFLFKERNKTLKIIFLFTVYKNILCVLYIMDNPIYNDLKKLDKYKKKLENLSFENQTGSGRKGLKGCQQ